MFWSWGIEWYVLGWTRSWILFVEYIFFGPLFSGKISRTRSTSTSIHFSFFQPPTSPSFSSSEGLRFRFNDHPFQCDQIGRFIALWATFQSLWQQLFCPNHPHFYTIFCKGFKNFIFLVNSFLGNFYRHMATFQWSHWSLRNSKFASATSSVTRYGNISPIWQSFKSIWCIFLGMSSILQNFDHTLVKKLCYWPNFHRFWPNVGKII